MSSCYVHDRSTPRATCATLRYRCVAMEPEVRYEVLGHEALFGDDVRIGLHAKLRAYRAIWPYDADNFRFGLLA